MIVDKIDSNKKPFHVIIGELKNNIFISSSDGGKYTGGGELSYELYKGFYNGPIDGTYKMWRIK